METQKPFYWYPNWREIAPPGMAHWPNTFIARHGWYQWTSRGLKYLGESMLDEQTFANQELLPE